MSREFRLPDLGEGIIEAQVIQVLVTEGQNIEEDHGLFEVETDKAAVEIPSPYAGTISKVHVRDGDTVNVGDVMVTFAGDGASAAASGAPPARAETVAEAAGETPVAAVASGSVATAAEPAPDRRTRAAAAPVVRKLARERGIDLDSIKGSGPGGRVTRADVEAAADRAPAMPAIREPTAPADTPERTVPPAPDAETAAAPTGIAETDKWGKVRRVTMPQIRKTIAQQMVRSVSNIPHVTHIDRADVTELEAMRRQYKEAHDGARRITAMAFIIKAVVKALRNYPVFNSSIDAQAGDIIYKDYINVGIAVDTDRGLVVPNVRNAQLLSVSQIAEELARIADRARKGRFAIEDLRGGTFTITNVGALGGIYSTPIINYPEAAILGLGRTQEEPVVREGRIVARSILPVSFSFDHRIADGAQAARFCSELLGYLNKPVTLLI